MEQTIPETLNFLYLGLGVTAALMGGYIASIAIRYRSLQKDAELIEQLAEDE